MHDDIRSQLRECENKIRGLREEEKRQSQVFDATRKAADASESEESLDAAVAAKEAVQQVQYRIQAAHEEQTALLRRLGDLEAGKAGFSSPGANGYAEAARKLTEDGVTAVDLGGDSLLRPMLAGGLDIDFAGGTARAPAKDVGVAPVAQDSRFVYRALRRQPAENELSVGGFKVNFAQEAVSGSVERDPISTANKAELAGNITWQTEDMRQFACWMEEVPQAILDAEPELQALLQGEMRYRLDLALDQHCVSGITALEPPSGSTGSGLIQQVRLGVAAMRGVGANPTALLLNPDDAADLDLSTSGADDLLVFSLRATGTSSPLWTLNIVESAAVDDPILLDPALIGPLFVGNGTILVNPFTGMRRNVIELRMELLGLFFGRDPRGAYVIS